ncbi:type III PLP-dependent enzyme [Streptomyces sp. SL13]|uniref:Type III PLP-dependent enzyme n=1 Tax=Streptantibioticus silvisoli TaxID=2705255 RepID=A0AA90H542_9ACTN|nr:type III PLP-dependent enzyme [Streptantibioticus silvisoli]MDI5970990.1 type III PLP-dependent enzyme [Streptantibioticus silvisoli]
MSDDLPRHLLAAFGSPLYLYRLDAAEDAAHSLRGQLPRGAALYYSLKANPHPALGEVLRAGGCRAEISSTGELAAALEAGWAGEDCLYTGPAKTAGEVAEALGRGVRRFSVESAADLDRVARTAAAQGRTAECLLRINSARSGASGLRMSGPSKFGVHEADVLARPERFADRPGARVVGAHYFPISTARSEDALIAEFTASIESARRLRDAGLPLAHLDLGGGFAAPYAEPGERPHYPRLREALETLLSSRLPGWRDGLPAVAFESGRHLVGGCGALVCTVAEVKENEGGRFVLVDSGIHHLGGMAGLGRLVRPAATPEPGAAHPALTSHLVGPLCTPADVLGSKVPVCAAGPGDVLVVPNTGAYGLTASLLGFLSRPAPAEVFVRGRTVVSASRLTLSRTPLDTGVDLPVPVTTTGDVPA